MQIIDDNDRDRRVAKIDLRMADAKARGTFWFPSPEEVQAIKRYDVRRQIEKDLGR